MIIITIMHLSSASLLTSFTLFLLLAYQWRKGINARVVGRASGWGAGAIVAPFPGSLAVPQSPHLQGWTPASFSEIDFGGGVCGSALLPALLTPGQGLCWGRCRIKKT